MTETRRMNRRHVFKIAAGAALGGALACGGAGVIVSRRPAIEMPTASHPGDGKRILIAYASATGTTAEAAVDMGLALAEMGFAVDVRPAAAVDPADVPTYDGTIVGSAIRMGQPMREAMRLFASPTHRLREHLTACFILCMVVTGNTVEALQEARGYASPLADTVGAQHVGVFPGALLRERLSPLEGVMTNMMGATFGDHRDWDAMRAWAREFGAAVRDS